MLSTPPAIPGNDHAPRVDAAWSTTDSAALYRVEDWGDRFFHVVELRS